MKKNIIKHTHTHNSSAIVPSKMKLFEGNNGSEFRDHGRWRRKANCSAVMKEGRKQNWPGLCFVGFRLKPGPALGSPSFGL